MRYPKSESGSQYYNPLRQDPLPHNFPQSCLFGDPSKLGLHLQRSWGYILRQARSKGWYCTGKVHRQGAYLTFFLLLCFLSVLPLGFRITWRTVFFYPPWPPLFLPAGTLAREGERKTKLTFQAVVSDIGAILQALSGNTNTDRSHTHTHTRSHTHTLTLQHLTVRFG